MFGDQKRSVVSAHVLMFDASKMNACVKGYKWIDTLKPFQWYNYEIYYIDWRWIKKQKYKEYK